MRASAAPNCGERINMSVAGPPASRISNTGTPSPPSARNDGRWKIGRNLALVTLNGMTAGEWLCTTA